MKKVDVKININICNEMIHWQIKELAKNAFLIGKK